jgi:hypothetical protein
MFWRDWILFGISFAAFIMSVITWVLKFIQDRKRIIITPNLISKSPEIYLLHITLENRSNKPISITNITIINDLGLVPCCQISKSYFHSTHRSGSEIISQRDEMSLGMPIPLGGRGAAAGVLIFVDYARILETGAKEWTLRLSTTRGALTQTISLDVPSLKIESL